MVAIEKNDKNFVFEVKGMHKVWALKSQLIIPIDHIITAYKNTRELKWLGLRMPGTQIPGLITAGTFLADEGDIFCDVANKEKAIMIELKDERYTNMIIEVEDVDAAIRLLTEK